MSENQKQEHHQGQNPVAKTQDWVEEIVVGDNLHGEVAGCPTGLSNQDIETKDDEKAEKGHNFKPEVEELKGSRITGRAR